MLKPTATCGFRITKGRGTPASPPPENASVRVIVGMHHGRLQFLAGQAEVENVSPGRSIKEKRLRFFYSGSEVWLQPFWF